MLEVFERKKIKAGAFASTLLFSVIQIILCQHISGDYQAFCGCMCLPKGSYVHPTK